MSHIVSSQSPCPLPPPPQKQGCVTPRAETKNTAEAFILRIFKQSIRLLLPCNQSGQHVATENHSALRQITMHHAKKKVKRNPTIDHSITRQRRAAGAGELKPTLWDLSVSSARSVRCRWAFQGYSSLHHPSFLTPPPPHPLLQLTWAEKEYRQRPNRRVGDYESQNPVAFPLQEF